jgi:hypothetical protein
MQLLPLLAQLVLVVIEEVVRQVIVACV